ncbi:ribosome maturation factor RimM [Campylobacter concisus]|uniref:ribosome maturation factor RimM n=1 Tax=Campylobacter concisus TaxID=199 RepID=UPI000CD98D41|nr:ribosome maturation factor RimM [Campylobacter concisus]
MNSDIVEVATIGRCVGLKGYLKLHNKSDFPEQFKKGATFFDKNNDQLLIIKDYNRQKELVLFENFDDLDLAKALVNKTIYTTKELTRKNCKLKKDEFFQFDIIGLKVVENGEILGIVEDIQDNFANSLLYIKTDEELIAGGKPKNFYIPYLEHFIESVNLDSGEILVKGARDILENS